jgi:antitoxin VapB
LEAFIVAKTAKIFTTGRSQAVRLPKEFRFTTDVVNISRDPLTGNIVLAETKKKDWASFFALVDKTEVPDNFLTDRDRQPAEDRRLFD